MDAADRLSSLSSHYAVLDGMFSAARSLLLAAQLVLFSVKQDIANSMNPGLVINRALYDGSGEMALGVWAAGVVSNTMPRDNTWFNLRYRDDTVNRLPGVAQYQKAQESVFYSMLAHSNFYEWGYEFAYEAGWACTAAAFIEPDDARKTVTFKLLRTGSFRIGEDEQGRVNVLAHNLYMEAGEILKRWPNVPADKAEGYRKDPYRKHEIRHMVRPRESWDPEDRTNKNFPFESTYVLTKDGNFLLEEGGFETFPFLVWRVERSPGSPWGTGPGFKFLRDGQIQQAVAETMLLADQKLVDPPLEAPESMQEIGLLTHPGGINYVPRSDIGVTRPLLQGISRPVGIDREERIRQSVERHFKLNFFLMQSQADKVMTRAEFLGRQSEQVASLAPIFGRFTSEVLDPMWAMLFRYAERFGLLPKPPEVVLRLGLGQMDVEYQSPMTTLQKRAHGLAGVEAFVQQVTAFNQAIMTAPPNVQDAIKQQDVVDLLAETNGVPTLLTDAEYRKKAEAQRREAAVLQAKAQAQQEAMAAQAGQAPRGAA